MRIAPLLVAVLLVLAGCSGFGGSSDETVTETVTDGSMTNATATAADGDGTATATDTGPAEDAAYPAGVTSAGVENLSALFEAQQAGLNGTSYVSQYWSNATAEQNGQTIQSRTHAVERVGSGGSPMAYTSNRTGPSGTQRVAIYGNGSVGLSRQVAETQFQNTTTYTRAISASNLQSRQGGNFFNLFIAFGNYTSVEQSSSGDGARFTLEATAQNETIAQQLNGDILSYDGTLVVDSAGVIHSADITTTINGSQGPTDYEIRYDLRSLGEDVTVSQPSWYDTALQETVDVSLETNAADNTAIELTNTGSDPIDAERTLILSREGSSGGFVTLDTPIEPGETVYLYKTSASGRFQVGSAVPNDAVALSGTYDIELTSNNGITSAQSTVSFD